jgi:hypothetical protein
VQVIKVDGVGLQPAQRRLAGERPVFRSAIDLAAFGPRLTPKVAELARQYDLISLSLKRLGQQFFIVPVIVVRRVDKVDAQIDGPMKNVNRLLLIDITKLADKGWTAVADSGDFEALFTEIAIVHLNFVSRWTMKQSIQRHAWQISAGNLAIRWSILWSLKDRRL